MALYFFDVHDSCGFHRDDVGVEFASSEAAHLQMRSLLTKIAQEERLDCGLQILSCSMRNDAGKIVYCADLTYQSTRLRGLSDGSAACDAALPDPGSGWRAGSDRQR